MPPYVASCIPQPAECMPMNSLYQYNAVLNNRPADILPWRPILMGCAARFTGRTYAEFAPDHRVLVEANLRCRGRFGFDPVGAISEPCRGTTGFGAEVECRARLCRPVPA